MLATPRSAGRSSSSGKQEEVGEPLYTLSTVASTREEDSWKRRDVKLHAHLSLAKSQKLEAHDKLQDPRTSSGSVCPLCILPILDPQSTAKSSSPEPEASAESMYALSSRRFVQGSKKNKPRSVGSRRG